MRADSNECFCSPRSLLTMFCIGRFTIVKRCWILLSNCRTIQRCSQSSSHARTVGSQIRGQRGWWVGLYLIVNIFTMHWNSVFVVRYQKAFEGSVYRLIMKLGKTRNWTLGLVRWSRDPSQRYLRSCGLHRIMRVIRYDDCHMTIR